MPFVNAVLLESLRYSALVPLSLLHYSSKDIPLKSGYVIPANAVIVPSLYHVMHDPGYWESPDKFWPERFLDESGKFIKDPRVIPFSIGKRYCLGQSLAEKEYFLFFTGIMQRFKLIHAPGSVLPSLLEDETNPKGAIRTAPYYEVIMHIRS